MMEMEMIVSPFETQLTREIREGKANPSRNMTNGKPFRTKAQKHEARLKAYRSKDGSWRSTAPVSFHPPARRSA